MLPEEQAKKLLKEYSLILGFTVRVMDNVISCALHTCDKLIKHCQSEDGNPPNLRKGEWNSEYWQDVKNVILKLNTENKLLMEVMRQTILFEACGDKDKYY